MLICILTMATTLMCVAFAVWAFARRTGDGFPLLSVAMGWGLIALCAICVACRANAPEEWAAVRNEVSDLNREYSEAFRVDPDPVLVDRYNLKARSFNARLKTNKASLANPWVSWFTCGVWNEFDSDSVPEITFIITTHPATPGRE